LVSPNGLSVHPILINHISDLSLQIPGSEVYEKLDKEFKWLMEHKKQLKGRKEDAGED